MLSVWSVEEIIEVVKVRKLGCLCTCPSLPIELYNGSVDYLHVLMACIRICLVLLEFDDDL